MIYAECSDEQLVELSRQGLAPAFSVLVHRHGPAILDRAQGDEDPVGATVAVFVRAMRNLTAAPEDDVDTWLRELATIELGPEADDSMIGSDSPTTPVRVGEPDDTSATQTIDPRLDEVWAELAVRWPTGRLARHLPSWAIWVGTILLLLALAILLPWALLGSINGTEPAVEELRASPILDDVDEDEEEEEEPPVEEETEPLPTFEFPEPPEQQTAPDSTTGASTPPADTSPTDGDAQDQQAGQGDGADPDGDAGADADTDPDEGGDADPVPGDTDGTGSGGGDGDTGDEPDDAIGDPAADSDPAPNADDLDETADADPSGDDPGGAAA